MFDQNDLQDLLNQLSLSEVDEARGWTRRNWTAVIKEAFTKAGADRRHYVCASGGTRCDWGEWLFDVTWLEVDEEKYITDLVLAMESEWGNPGDVYDDFMKLLSSRARLRVIVFQAQDDAVLQKIIVDLTTGLQRFKRSQDESLTLWGCYLTADQRFLTGKLS